MDKQQHNGPFNYRDSEMVEEFRKKLENDSINYDDEPVTACPLCNSLHLKEVDDKLECFNCGNELEEKDVVVYKSIHKYLEEKDEQSS